MIPGTGTTITYASGATSSTGTVVHVADAGDGRSAIVLDTTAFHPVDTAWPDQPADRGTLSAGGATHAIVDAVVGATQGGELVLGRDVLLRLLYGARVIEQGAISDDIYFVEEGEGVVQLEPKDGAPVKLAAFGSGTIIGEIAFYRGEPRSASVIAHTPIVASRLSRAALSRIDAEVPALAARFHQEMARALAGRLQGANRLIHVLAD